MTWGLDEQRWVVTDSYGRTWRLAIQRGNPPIGALTRTMRPLAMLEELLEDAFAPWGEHRFPGALGSTNSWAVFYWRLRFGGQQNNPLERIQVSDLAGAMAL